MLIKPFVQWHFIFTVVSWPLENFISYTRGYVELYQLIENWELPSSQICRLGRQSWHIDNSRSSMLLFKLKLSKRITTSKGFYVIIVLYYVMCLPNILVTRIYRDHWICKFKFVGSRICFHSRIIGIHMFCISYCGQHVPHYKYVCQVWPVVMSYNEMRFCNTCICYFIYKSTLLIVRVFVTLHMQHVPQLTFFRMTDNWLLRRWQRCHHCCEFQHKTK